MLSRLPKTCLVVPCYNEAERLRPTAFIDFAVRNPTIRFCFVNDGSSDATNTLLRDLVSALGDQGHLLSLTMNSGKAHAVRMGVLQALSANNVDYIGYWDADLATPLDELARLLDRVGPGGPDVICASRWRRMGANIRRSGKRHIAGRVFATMASLAIGHGFYDTQCGAKVFSAPLANVVFEKPFISKWIFDVELLIRSCEHLTRAGKSDSVIEVPLMTWQDVPGSKLTPRHVMRAAFDLFRIYRLYRCNQIEVDSQVDLDSQVDVDSQHESNKDRSARIDEQAA